MRAVLGLAFLAAAALAQTVVDPPTQVRLAFAGNDGNGRSDGMSFVWATNNATATSVVRVGSTPAPSSMTITASGTQATYWQTWLHTAVVTGLQASTTYFYQVGDDAAGWSDVAWFTTAPVYNSQAEVRIAVVADMGVNNIYEQGYASRQYLSELVAADAVDFTIHAGDIFYADDAFLVDPIDLVYDQIWDRGGNLIENITNTKAYMTCPGNHEAECHSPACDLDSAALEAFHNFTAYNARFRMPSPESGGVLNMWYSYAYGPATFISIDTETDFPNAPNDQYQPLPNGGFGQQLAWVQQALAAANATRNIRPWIVVVGHRPLYSLDSTDASGAPTGEAADFQTSFENLFHAYGVDLYICGHVHGSEASFPTLRNTPTQTNWVSPRATTYLVVGGAGNIENLTDYGADPNATTIPWNAYVNGAGVGDGGDYIVGLMTINTTAINFEFHKAVDGTVDFALTITK